MGYRTRIRLSKEEAKQAATLLSLERPKAFVASTPPTEQALFEECSLGILSSRQSTNFRGHRQVTLGPEDSQALAAELRQLSDLEAPVLDHATHTHVVLSRPYRTPFTFLLTFVGHLPLLSLLTVPIRSFRKKTQHIDDIRSSGSFPHYIGAFWPTQWNGATWLQRVVSKPTSCLDPLVVRNANAPTRPSSNALQNVSDSRPQNADRDGELTGGQVGTPSRPSIFHQTCVRARTPTPFQRTISRASTRKRRRPRYQERQGMSVRTNSPSCPRAVITR